MRQGSGYDCLQSWQACNLCHSFEISNGTSKWSGKYLNIDILLQNIFDDYTLVHDTYLSIQESKRTVDMEMWVLAVH